jgi:hypothetical protein
MVPPVVSAPRSAPPAPAHSRAATRRKAPRPQPRIPADFFDPQTYTLLIEVFSARAARWKADSLPPLYFYGRESEPHWDEVAQQRCSGTTLRIAGQRVLYECLSMDLERGLRLLTLVWTNERRTSEGHTLEAWQAALAGVLWRIGQVYREFVRRKGEEQARETVRLTMNTLWGEPFGD